MKVLRRLGLQSSIQRDHTPSLDDILTVVCAHHANADLALIKQAHDEAARWHKGQIRRSGDPYITHCLAVAAILADMGMPPLVVCAGLLHDIHDTPCPLDHVVEQFGQEIVHLITAASMIKAGVIPPNDLTRDAAADLADEEAVVALCLADRLHNLRTIAFLAPATQQRKASQTLEVLVPVARAAGLMHVERELRDLSVAVLSPAPAASAVTTRLLTVLTLPIPAPQRARWRDEWHGELATLPTRRARTHFTFRILLSTPRMSLILRRPGFKDRRW
ncbi:HD domain-containing protein [Streptomyces sp. S1D4-11]|nr:HD domain-containing protein [Streptomyces sp. S1D4-11]QIZ01061.1 HD domain-containing protein [Streptomyces sp. S1D4-11]